jgi:hypothetical protein
MMHIPKKYGQSRIEPCPFCQKAATAKNRQDIPVCGAHQAMILPDMKCACGSYLELRSGKFGSYFHCRECGNISMRKALSMNPIPEEKRPSFPEKQQQGRKEITITSDQVDVYFS